MVRIPPFQGGGSCSIHGSCILIFFVWHFFLVGSNISKISINVLFEETQYGILRGFCGSLEDLEYIKFFLFAAIK